MIRAMGEIKLLLIEDDEDDYIITRDLLEDIASDRYRLDWAQDLDTARDLLQLNAHDVCLMDYALGAVDGISLLKEAQTLGFTRPIIMLTGQDDDVLDQQALAAGAVDYLVKSVLTKSRLERAIRYAVARREMELERIERLRAESENRAKSEFLAHLSHELRTPLTSILGYTDLLLRQPQHKVVEYLNIIKRNGHHLLSLLNDVLDLSKIEAGKLDIEDQMVDLPQLLNDLYHLLRVRAEDKDIQLCFGADGGIPWLVRTDPTRLRQILLNILGNAIKFTDQGKVEMEIDVVGEAPTVLLEFRIRDTGVGIAPDDLPRLFKPFSQAQLGDEHRHEGTGLGLAISHRLAQRLGGDIKVDSTPGQGSCFTVTVEVIIPEDVKWGELQETQPSETVSDRSLPQLKARILVADDVEELRTLLGQIISGLGAEVAFAADGRDAVEQALAAQNSQPFDLILMDVQMPRMNGLDATRSLRAAGLQQPIIALTAATMRGERERCLDAGCNDHLSKPITESSLIQCICYQLESRLEDQDTTSPRVLLIEDDADARAITALLIENLGWQVDQAETGAQAEETYQRVRPQLVLMDMSLPDCRGDELAEKLRQLEPECPPIVLLSGYEMSDSERRDSVFDDHLLKPVNLEVIQGLLEKSVDKNVGTS
ncbi:MAG: hybrid sensor histidine kinase/response regulator [Pseudomonadales bacterium]|nr:hybrid sensor histidine kinase/response regulator [Pseudomonadales bacterium]